VPPRKTAPAPRAADETQDVDADGTAKSVDSGGRAGAPAQGRELRARGKRTMRKLLDAGIEVFSKRGYHSARVDDIVKAAKTSHGTFYLYFSNKEDLFQALVADVADELATVTAALGPVTPDRAGYDELRSWLARFTDMYEHYGPIIRTWTEAEIGESEAGRMGTDVLAELATAISSRLAKGSRTIDPTIASLAVIAMIERFNYFVLSGQVDADRDKLLDTLAAVVFDALFAPAASRT
jgi:AcrR family transcriptional regulator